MAMMARGNDALLKECVIGGAVPKENALEDDLARLCDQEVQEDDDIAEFLRGHRFATRCGHRVLCQLLESGRTTLAHRFLQVASKEWPIHYGRYFFADVIHSRESSSEMLGMILDTLDATRDDIAAIPVQMILYRISLPGPTAENVRRLEEAGSHIPPPTPVDEDVIQFIMDRAGLSMDGVCEFMLSDMTAPPNVPDTVSVDHYYRLPYNRFTPRTIDYIRPYASLELLHHLLLWPCDEIVFRRILDELCDAGEDGVSLIHKSIVWRGEPDAVPRSVWDVANDRFIMPEIIHLVRCMSVEGLVAKNSAGETPIIWILKHAFTGFHTAFANLKIVEAIAKRLSYAQRMTPSTAGETPLDVFPAVFPEADTLPANCPELSKDRFNAIKGLFQETTAKSAYV